MARTKNRIRNAKGGDTRDVQVVSKPPGVDKKKAKAKIKAKSKAKYAAKIAKQELKRAAKEEKELEELKATNEQTEDYHKQDDNDDDGFIEMDMGLTEKQQSNGRTDNGFENDDTEDGQEEDSANRLMHETMPWMRDRKGYYDTNLYLCLHEEIMDFVRFMSPTDQELERRRQLVAEMKELVASLWKGATVETFGSHHTQMFLPKSDIDMVVFSDQTGTKPLFELGQKLGDLDLVSYLEVIDKARIPIVKFVHKASNIHVDVSFNIAGGLATADLVKHYMRVYPSFRPLTLVIKYFLAQRGLNETFTGGLGSFLVQLMVVSFLQHHRRHLGAEHDDPKYNNLGQLLIGFFTLYGRDFNYDDLGISVRNGGSYFRKEERYWYDENRPFLISMENPNEPSLDIGKNSYDIRIVRRSFAYARQVLINEIHRRGQFHPLTGSILGTIIPADSDLLERIAPKEFGFDILHHNPKKTAEIRRQYEARRDEELRKKQAANTEKRDSKSYGRRQDFANEPPAKRWRGRTSRNYGAN